MSEEETLRTPSTATVAAAPVVVPGLHRKVSAFNAHQEEYVEHLELYFMANDITDLAKREPFCAGPATYQLPW